MCIYKPYNYIAYAFVNFETYTPISYNITRGTTKITWLNISGGVIIADKISITTYAYFLYEFNI